MNILVYSSRKYENPYFEKAFSSKSEKLKLNYTTDSLNTDTASYARGKDAIVLFTEDSAKGEVLDKLKENGVQYIATRTMGTDHIDIDHARSAGIKVANVPNYSPHCVAEHALALLLALNRKLITANHKIMAHDFSLDGLVGTEIHGKTAGIIGTGDIGAQVVKILCGFGCNVLMYDVKQDNALEEKGHAKYVSFDELIQQSDIISLHTPLTEQTANIINEESISKMKDGVVLINVSRGELINTKDVIEGLKNRKIASLGLDVYEREKELFYHNRTGEPLVDDNFARLISFNNVLVTGHMAFLTDNALAQDMEVTKQNLLAWEKGEKPQFEQ